MSTELLEEEIVLVTRGMAHPARIDTILKILVTNRHVQPSTRHYEAQILANCHPELGSADKVMSILQMMTRENISFNSSISFAVLKVCYSGF